MEKLLFTIGAHETRKIVLVDEKTTGRHYTDYLRAGDGGDVCECVSTEVHNFGSFQPY